MKLLTTLLSLVIFVSVLFPPRSTLAQETQGELRAPILDAASTGDLEQVKSLIGSGADVNLKGKANETPLMVAVSKRHPAVVDALLKAGADVNSESVLGWTPLMWAVQSSPDILKRLLQGGVKINAKSSRSGRTALMLASVGDNSLRLKILLANNADPNLADNEGQTALMRAVIDCGELATVKALLNAVAKVDSRDNKGRRALDYAIEMDATDTISLLRGHK